MTQPSQDEVEAVARVIAGHVGEHYNELPGDNEQRRIWHRFGRILDINVLTKEDCDDIARETIQAIDAHRAAGKTTVEG